MCMCASVCSTSHKILQYIRDKRVDNLNGFLTSAKQDETQVVSHRFFISGIHCLHLSYINTDKIIQSEKILDYIN